ncbi:cellulase (glycosyl hydrolase family 5) [Hephaestia caeni]|uniref:Cellulase (Glycosyl hydrolase family 5) n=1 Tax=Hephaestia caeni TaxID=645617 RepID=A0A397P9S8_9SPHN|nr:cellulase family glycosylhydrolase [Hephaestia caeni]RIA45678.1 cellulase (glycosyl hydrolase family 5) [Hephaestia caeni]
MPFRLIAAALLLCLSGAAAQAQGFLHTRGTEIVDGDGAPVLLRGMGLGGWMLQEGYMLGLGDLEKGQQHVVRQHIAELIGPDRTADFYRAWLDHYITKADVDAMGRWGFNSIRLPMHYNLLLDEAVPAGVDRWKEDGFARIDALIDWARANRIYVILDLHAAPGGQGADLPIADRDPDTPSLWDSAENQRRTVALWHKLATRYADEPWVGGYDILNEPNWDFDGEGGGHGCKEQGNAPLTALLKRITSAIRAVDRRHLIVIEGNCWGNNYAGMLPAWDGNMVLSFHKYWNHNTDADLTDILGLREKYGMPVWLGESGENSNVWFRDAIRLVERHGIGWSWWPLKKIGFNNPLEVAPNPGWKKLVDYWIHDGPRPSTAEADQTLMRLATHDIAFENNIRHPDVIDAMFRLPHSDRAIPFAPHVLGKAPLTIAAVDYDMGPAGVAYHDRVDANYHIATGGDRTEWNDGRTYRNDGVDIAREADGTPFVDRFEAGEWMQYTITAEGGGAARLVLATAAARGATIGVRINDGPAKAIAVHAANGWTSTAPIDVTLLPGINRLKIAVHDGEVRLKALRLALERRRE